jgi:hypothetical protein
MSTLYQILLKCRSAEIGFVNLFMMGAVLGSAWLLYHLAKLALLEMSMLIP